MYNFRVAFPLGLRRHKISVNENYVIRSFRQSSSERGYKPRRRKPYKMEKKKSFVRNQTIFSQCLIRYDKQFVTKTRKSVSCILIEKETFNNLCYKQYALGAYTCASSWIKCGSF